MPSPTVAPASQTDKLPICLATSSSQIRHCGQSAWPTYATQDESWSTLATHSWLYLRICLHLNCHPHKSAANMILLQRVSWWSFLGAHGSTPY